MQIEGKQLGQYRILHSIGRGGMGEVYLARDLQIPRDVAVKVVRIEATQSGDGAITNALRLFLREATAIARLDHPNILPLYHYGEETIDNTHIAYLVIPYRARGSLVNWLSQRAAVQRTQELTLKQVEHIIQQAGIALQYAHNHLVMHLDVKPANFLIRSETEADEYPDLLLTDFGIARLASTTSSASQNVRGTPTYMAPEQWSGSATFASDQYALAVMAYELLTGSPPFQGSPMEVMYGHLQVQPKPSGQLNPLLPPAVDAVLLRALAKKPEERFSSVAAFVQAFQAALQSLGEGTTIRVLPPNLRVSHGSGIKRTGDVFAQLAISAEEARSGTWRSLTLADGRAVGVQIPSGAQHGQVITLFGQGEMQDSGTTGNLFITLSLMTTQPPPGYTPDRISMPSLAPPQEKKNRAVLLISALVVVAFVLGSVMTAVVNSNANRGYSPSSKAASPNLSATATFVAANRGHNPGPHGAPPNAASGTITTDIKGFGQVIALTVIGSPDGGAVCGPGDDDQPHTLQRTASDGTAYTETWASTCSGTYKDGALKLDETETFEKIVWSNGTTCAGAVPFTNLHIEGTFTSATSIRGTYWAGTTTWTCDHGATTTNSPDAGNWTGTASMK